MCSPSCCQSVQGHFSEKDAAEKMRSLLDFISFAHSKNIIHRYIVLGETLLNGALFRHAVASIQQAHPSPSPPSCHARVHRDLKPENILLSDKNPTAALKVIDFGTSDFCLPGQHLSQKFGTPYYVAPEVRRPPLDQCPPFSLSCDP